MIVKLLNNSTVILRHRPKIFDLFFPKSLLFSWDGVVWVHKNIPLASIPIHALMREYVHLFQQVYLGKAKWIKGYIFSKKFRLEREVEAYAYQLKFITTKEERSRILEEADAIFSTDRRVKCAKEYEFYDETMARYMREKSAAKFTVKRSLLDD